MKRELLAFYTIRKVGLRRPLSKYLSRKGNTMARYEISYIHKDANEVILASKHVVDGDWIVFLDYSGQVSRKRACDIESVERLDN